MINSAIIREYFSRLATEHKWIKSFFYGDFDEILNAERSQIDYPFLWLESPDVNFTRSQGSDSIKVIHDVAFNILFNVSPSRVGERQARIDQAEQIAGHILWKMDCDQDEENIRFFYSSANMFPIVAGQGSDNEVGFRVECEIQPLITTLDAAGYFSDIFPALTQASFTWLVTDNGGDRTVDLSNTTTPSLVGFTFEFKVWDGITWQTNTNDQNPSFTCAGEQFYFELSVTKDNQTRYSSAYYLATDPEPSGLSMAGQFNPLQ